MVNSQFGFRMSAPVSPVAKGISVTFSAPTGITSIADTSSGKWCTAGNLIAFNSGTGTWVECSVTYYAAGGSQPQGWYFWYGWSGNTTGTFVSISTPSGTQTLKLLNVNGNWGASYNGGSLRQIVGATNFDIALGRIMFENGGNTTCSNYSSFGGLDFNNLTYYDANNSVISFTSTATVWRQNQPNTCPDTKSCMDLNLTNLIVSRHC